MINGMVDRPLVFTYADLERFPRENHVYFWNARPIPAWNGLARS